MKNRLYIVAFFLLTTVLPATAQILKPDQNPKFNTELNPKFNTRISPIFNFSINPKITFSINPKFTTRINPDYTSSINPNYNSNVDPRYNSDINPRFNTRLNPRFMFWTGQYLFDETDELAGYLVSASDKVFLYYNPDNEWIGFFVKAESNYNLFTLEGKWTGEYLCFDSKTGYNFFDAEGEWTKKYAK